MDARYVRVSWDDPALLRNLFSELELSGASVTLPHKEAAGAGVDERDSAAQGIGAVNTIVCREGKLTGFNTDALGAAEAVGNCEGKRVLVLGAGGAARAIAWGLVRGGARITIANRSIDRARALAEIVGGATVEWDRRGTAEAEVVVNATSVGMESDESPYPAERWRTGMRAFDAVYTPRWTRFLREAKAAGVETVQGLEMFLRQADRQFEIFTGRRIPESLLREFRDHP